MTTQAIRSMLLGLALALAGASCAVQPNPVPVPAPATAETAQSSGYIVQAASVEQAAAAVEAVGGEVTHELGMIRAVGALLSPLQAAMLRERTDVRRVFEDATVRTSSACGVSTGTTRWKTTSFTGR